MNTPQALELIVLRTHPSYMVGWDAGRDGADAMRWTYRLSGSDQFAVPGYRVTLEQERTWRHKGRDFVGGPLMHVGFSVLSLTRAQFPVPSLEASGRLFVPGMMDPRAGRALEMEPLSLSSEAHMLEQLSLCLDILEDFPANSTAHVLAGRIYMAFGLSAKAHLHLTAAVRLFLTAVDGDRSPLPRLETEPHDRLAVQAFCLRARSNRNQGLRDSAQGDWEAANKLDPKGIVTSTFLDLVDFYSGQKEA